MVFHSRCIRLGTSKGGEMMKCFLRWWVIVAGTLTGIGFLIVYDCINYINNADVTKLSFVIAALFIHSTIQVGRSTYKRDKKHYYHESNLNIPRFMVKSMKQLGMLGTVIGLIMMSTCLLGVSFTNVHEMQGVIGNVLTGMSTALVTTASGLVFGLLLELQLFNYDQGK